MINVLSKYRFPSNYNYRNVKYDIVVIKGVSILKFKDGNAIINDWYDSKMLGLKHTKIRDFDELKELIESRI